MAISLNCPECDKRYNVPDDKAGRKFRCRNCQAVIKVPDDDVYDDEAYEDYEDEWDEPAPRRRQSPRRSGKKTAPKKQKSFPLLPVAAGGGAVLVIIGAIVAFVLLRDGGDEEDGDRGNQVAQNSGGENRGEESTTGDAGQGNSGNSIPGVGSNLNSTAARSPGLPDSGPRTNAAGNAVAGGRPIQEQQSVNQKLKQIGRALHNYHQTFRTFPPDPTPEAGFFGKDGRPFLSWRVHLLPFLDQQALFQKFKLNEPWDSPNNKPLLDSMPDIFRSPGDASTSSSTRFRGFAGSRTNGKATTMFAYGGKLGMRHVVDGTSNTLYLIEAGPDKGTEWTKPEELEIVNGDPLASAGKVDPAGVPALLVDGSTWLIKPGAAPTEVLKLVSPQDGQIVDTRSLLAQVETAPAPRSLGDFKPRTGPLPTAYLTDDCLALVMVRPRSLLSSNEVRQLIPPDALKRMLGGPASKVNADEIDQMLFWITGTPDDEFYAAVQFTSDKTAEDAAATIGARANELTQHDAKTWLIAKPQRLQKLSNAENGNSKLKAQLESHLGDSRPAHVMAVVSVPMALNHPQAQSPGVAQMLQSPQFAQVRQIESIGLTVDLRESDFIRLDATAVSPAAATFLRNTINSMVNQQLPPNAPPQIVKTFDMLKSSTTIAISQDDPKTVVTTMKKNDELFALVGQQIRTGMMAGQAAASRAVQQNNIKQIALAMHNYHDTFGSLPVAKDPKLRNANGPYLSWRVHILPYLDHIELYREFHLDEPWDSPHNIKLLDRMPRIYAVPGVQKTNHTSMLTFTGPAGLFRDPGPGFVDVRDGTSNTILMIQAGPDKAVPWTKPEDITANPDDPMAPIGTVGPGFHAALCNGQVRFISATIDKSVLSSMINPNDGQP